MTTAAAARRVRGGRFNLVQLFLNGAGRIDRRTFAPALVAVCVVARFAMGAEGVLSWTLWSAALVTACALLSKRLHDLSLAGWWSAGPVGLVAVAVNGEAPTTAAQATAVLLAAGGVAILAFWPGEGRFNRFGPASGESAPTSAHHGEGRAPSAR